MAPFGINQSLDRVKLMEARASSIRRTVRLAFDQAMKQLNSVRENLEVNGGGSGLAATR